RGLCFVRSGLKDDVDRSDISLRVVTDCDAVNQSCVDQVSLKSGIGLLHDERKSIGRISRGVILTDRWTLPADLDQNVRDWLLDNVSFALGQRWVFDQRELRERI